ncbi:hypothetical protein [Streptomyces sp. GESEQ-4]|uniref:hypothetical protein n=1 Tax=Streptomyces sp. GESEQ-4 TaxID=2812655 RepID=UPI001B32778B|nr:hypothetical protein [Streptomyces sp. GESEQ-4]
MVDTDRTHDEADYFTGTELADNRRQIEGARPEAAGSMSPPAGETCTSAALFSPRAPRWLWS